MDRITSSQVSDLMEAYAAVYAPQEITEEQVWEEVESWVNSLVEEGYDLSEYTWEDMYEHYLNEMGQRMTTGQATAPKAAPAKPQPQLSGLTIGPGGFRINNKPVQTGMSPIFQRPGQAPTRPAAPVTRPAAPAARPAAPAARPAATARPAAPAPKAAPAAPSIERRIPTSAELRQAQQARTAGSNLTGTGALASKPAAPAAAPAPAATPAPAAKPSLQQSIRNRRLNMDLDLFDVIKGHLLDEGYADTEEAALKIMANMSEEWKQSILESDA